MALSTRVSVEVSVIVEPGEEPLSERAENSKVKSEVSYTYVPS